MYEKQNEHYAFNIFSERNCKMSYFFAACLHITKMEESSSAPLFGVFVYRYGFTISLPGRLGPKTVSGPDTSA